MFSHDFRSWLPPNRNFGLVTSYEVVALFHWFTEKAQEAQEKGNKKTYLALPLAKISS